jgi:hypothetical protein
MGFVVDDDTTWVGGVGHRLGHSGTGVVGWTLRGIDRFDEVPTQLNGGTAPPLAQPSHPNGAVALDHVVISTPQLDRTVAAFEHGGMPLRRTRQAGTAAHPMTQAFFKISGVVVEIVGPSGDAEGATRFWGLTFTVSDLDATAEFLGEHLRPIRPAVQSGRRIATLDRSVGSTVPIAFMSGKE